MHEDWWTNPSWMWTQTWNSVNRLKGNHKEVPNRPLVNRLLITRFKDPSFRETRWLIDSVNKRLIVVAVFIVHSNDSLAKKKWIPLAVLFDSKLPLFLKLKSFHNDDMTSYLKIVNQVSRILCQTRRWVWLIGGTTNRIFGTFLKEAYVLLLVKNRGWRVLVNH